MTIIQSKPKPPLKGKLAQHPTARVLQERHPQTPTPLTWDELRQLAIKCGADDASAVSLSHPDLAEEVPHVTRALPSTQTLIALVMKMHPDDIRSPARSIANNEFHRVGDATDTVSRRLAMALSARGYPSINPAMAFPMEMEQFPDRAWVVSHKKVALAAQLGKTGIHRNVIHPKFGSFILLGTVLTSAPLPQEQAPTLDFNPCVSCRLCVASCPVGAIEPNGTFRFSACYDHNYREFMSGFTDLLEEVADSKDRADLRTRITPSEGASMWQSLSYKPNYKAAHCIAVCPAGEEILGPYLEDRKDFVRQVFKPLVEREETVYVVKGSDAQTHVQKRFPHKKVRIVRSSLRPGSVKTFFHAITLTFQRGPSKGWSATYHFNLTGKTPTQATVHIKDGTLEIEPGLVGKADLVARVDGELWLEIVAKKRNAAWAVVTGKMKLQGNPKLLKKFESCFPR